MGHQLPDNHAMATSNEGPVLTNSPQKRKRNDVTFSGALSDVESCDVGLLRTKSKKVRLFRSDLDDASSVPSLTETDATTPANTVTPFTDTSSTRGSNKTRVKKFLCPYHDCGKAFDRPIRLQTHINSHTGERPHVCSEQGCDKKFFKAEHLKQHIHDKHTNYNGFVCSYEIHDDTRGGLVECGRTFPTASKLKRHKAQHEQKEETRCSWEGCGKEFRKQETLQRHVKKDHLKDENAYQCSEKSSDGAICGQFFATPGQLRSHKVREHDEPRYWCDICAATMVDDAVNHTDGMNDTSAPQIDDLLPESQSEIIAQQMQSYATSTSFTSYGALQLHMKQCHPPMCPECRKECQSNRELKAHIDIEHPSPDVIAEPGGSKDQKQYLCPVPRCDRALPENGFTRKGNLLVHIKNVHAEEKSFVCGKYDIQSNEKLTGWNGEGCGYAVKTKQSLISHIRTQHLGIPAAVGAKTGLRDEDRTRRVRKKAEGASSTVFEPMDVDELPGSNQSNNAMSLLTGVGYELRPFACFMAESHGCQVRFNNQYGLIYHMEMTHGWNVDDVNDALQSVNASASEHEFRYRLEQGVAAMQDPVPLDALDPRLYDTTV